MANHEGIIPQLDNINRAQPVHVRDEQDEKAVKLTDTLSTLICVLGYQIVDANTKRAMMQMDQHGAVPDYSSQWLKKIQEHAWLQLQVLRQVILLTTDPSTPPISDK